MKNTLLLAFFVALIPFVSSAQITLNYNLDELTKYNSKIIVEQGIAQTVMGQTQNNQNDQGYGITLTLASSNTDSYTLNMVYNSIMINSPMAGLTYDSEKATSEPTGALKAVASIVGTELNFELNKYGLVNNVSGVDAMLDSMAKNMGLTDSLVTSAFKTQMEGQYNAESIKSQMKKTLIIYPDKELNKGDKWSADESVSVPFSMNIQTTYELADYDENTATINVSSDIFTDGGSMTVNGATMTPDLTGVQSGTIIVDRKTGLVLSTETEQLITGAMNMTSPSEMEIPIEISGSSTTKGSIE